MAATLLRVLAKKGRSTIAFKPHAAVNFFKSIDSLIQQGSGHVAGGDAAAFAPLCTAIPDDVSTSDISSVLSCNRSWFYFSIREE